MELSSDFAVLDVISSTGYTESLVACALLALGLFVAVAYPRFISAGLQVLLPLDKSIASVGAVRFLSVAPGSTEWQPPLRQPFSALSVLFIWEKRMLDVRP